MCVSLLHVHAADVAGMKPVPEENNTAGFCLTLPGKRLYLTPLLAMKKFRKRGNKDGAIAAFYQLEEQGLGKVLEVAGGKGTSAVSANVHNVKILTGK